MITPNSADKNEHDVIARDVWNRFFYRFGFETIRIRFGMRLVRF